MNCVHLGTLVAVFTVGSLCFPSASCAQFSIIQHFPTYFGPSSTAISDSRVYGLGENPPPHYFSFNLDGTDLVTTDLNPGPFLPAINSGPLGISGTTVVGTTSFGTVLTADGTNTRTIFPVPLTPQLVENNPLVIDSAIYGAYFRPDVDQGGFYKMKLDGSGFESLYATDTPVLSILETDGVSLYGGSMKHPLRDTAAKLYRANLDSSGGAILYEFGTDVSAIGPVAVSGDTVFGVTSRHVVGENSQLFSISKDGTDFTVLKEFEGGPNDPVPARLVSDGEELYGVAQYGSGEGAIIRSSLDGTEYEVIHRFGSGPDNGRYPNTDLVVIESKLYGSTLQGGRNEGGIFYFITADTAAVPEPASLVVWFMLGSIGIVCGVYRKAWRTT